MYLRSQLILPRSIYDSPLKVRTSLLDCFNNMQLTLRLLNAHNCRCQKQMCCHICWRGGMVNEKHYVWWRRGGRPWCLTLMHSVAGNGNHASDLLYERLLFLKTNTHFSCSSKRCTQLTLQQPQPSVNVLKAAKLMALFYVGCAISRLPLLHSCCPSSCAERAISQ